VHVRPALALTVVVSALSTGVGCGSGDRTLDVLERESLASFVAPGGTVEPEQDANDDDISRVFAYEDTVAAEAGRTAAIAAARASGWTLTFDEEAVGDPIFGAKELSTGELNLVIGQYEEGDLVKVSIRLEHGPCARCEPGGRQEPNANESEKQDQPSGDQQSAGDSDDALSVPGTILVLPSRPNAWAGGPYVTKLGGTLELDASGSYDSDGRIVKYEWDLDGDGDFDVSTTKATYMHTFTKPIDGTIAVRVTDDDGRSHVAKARAHASSDGDEVPPLADNCPNVANHGQSDWDEDGIGDECDPTPFGG
jgi:PKD domain